MNLAEQLKHFTLLSKGKHEEKIYYDNGMMEFANRFSPPTSVV